MVAPSWLALLAPIPAGAAVLRGPVASAELIEQGKAGPIAGWDRISVSLSEPDHGLRHVLITLDADRQLLAASDHVMFVRTVTSDGGEVLLSDHESIGGRFVDGSFRGTYWLMTIEGDADGDEKNMPRRSDQRPPTEAEVASLRALVADVLARAPRP